MNSTNKHNRIMFEWKTNNNKKKKEKDDDELYREELQALRATFGNVLVDNTVDTSYHFDGKTQYQYHNYKGIHPSSVDKELNKTDASIVKNTLVETENDIFTLTTLSNVFNTLSDTSKKIPTITTPSKKRRGGREVFDTGDITDKETSNFYITHNNKRKIIVTQGERIQDHLKSMTKTNRIPITTYNTLYNNEYKGMESLYIYPNALNDNIEAPEESTYNNLASRRHKDKMNNIKKDKKNIILSNAYYTGCLSQKNEITMSDRETLIDNLFGSTGMKKFDNLYVKKPGTITENDVLLLWHDNKSLTKPSKELMDRYTQLLDTKDWIHSDIIDIVSSMMMQMNFQIGFNKDIYYWNSTNIIYMRGIIESIMSKIDLIEDKVKINHGISFKNIIFHRVIQLYQKKTLIDKKPIQTILDKEILKNIRVFIMDKEVSVNSNYNKIMQTIITKSIVDSDLIYTSTDQLSQKYIEIRILEKDNIIKNIVIDLSAASEYNNKKIELENQYDVLNNNLKKLLSITNERHESNIGHLNRIKWQSYKLTSRETIVESTTTTTEEKIDKYIIEELYSIPIDNLRIKAIDFINDTTTMFFKLYDIFEKHKIVIMPLNEAQIPERGAGTHWSLLVWQRDINILEGGIVRKTHFTHYNSLWNSLHHKNLVMDFIQQISHFISELNIENLKYDYIDKSRYFFTGPIEEYDDNISPPYNLPIQRSDQCGCFTMSYIWEIIKMKGKGDGSIISEGNAMLITPSYVENFRRGMTNVMFDYLIHGEKLTNIREELGFIKRRRRKKK